MNFYETVMGKHYYQATLPSIAKSAEKIADALEVIASRLETKETPEKWIAIRMSGFDQRGKCEFQKLSLPENRFFANGQDAVSMMRDDIEGILSTYTGKLLSYDSEESNSLLDNAGLDIQVGDYSAELYRGDTVVYCWKVMRVA